MLEVRVVGNRGEVESFVRKTRKFYLIKYRRTYRGRDGKTRVYLKVVPRPED